MHLKKIILVCFSLSILLFGCQNKKWKKPTQVNFVFSLSNTSSLNGDLSFQNGFIKIKEFTFHGVRSQGGDVDFTTYYEAGKNISMNSLNGESLSFDIPQGNYLEIAIKLRTEGQPGENTIVTEGTYKNSLTGEILPLRFEVELSEVFNIVLKNSENATNVVFVEDNCYSAGIHFDLYYWFQPLTSVMLDEAEVNEAENDTAILINSESNEVLYELILERMEEGIIAKIDD